MSHDPAPARAQEPASPDATWSFEYQGRRYGPVSTERIQQLCVAGVLAGDSRVHSTLFDRWVDARTVPALRATLGPRADAGSVVYAGTDSDGVFALADGANARIGPRPNKTTETSCTTEESDEVIRARIAALLRERLEDPAEGEEFSLLDKYIGYREAARSLKEAAGPTSIRSRALSRYES